MFSYILLEKINHSEWNVNSEYLKIICVFVKYSLLAG